jgi:bifunctional DNase/RNase
MVLVQIVGIRLDPLTGTSAVLLGDADRPTRILPIMVGIAEAQSIAGSLLQSVPPRPGTHDLTTELMSIAGSRLEEVVVTELRDGIFYAELFVEAADGMKSVSARPSDGIALAVRVGAPIYVRAEVLDEAAVQVDHESSDPLTDEEIDEVVKEFQTFLESATPSDFSSDSTADVPDDSSTDEWQPHERPPDEDIGWADDD